MGMAAALAVLGTVYTFPPSQTGFYPRCPFYICTGLWCPGCGGTRAFYELLHLNLRGALHWNALLTVLIPWILMWAVWCCYQAVRYNRFPSLPWPRTIALGLSLASVMFAVARNTGIAFAI
jgi:hypothetical protein